VVGKRKTIQFTVTCVMITIVQKIVILKSMLGRGRSFSCSLFRRFSSAIRGAYCNYRTRIDTAPFWWILLKIR
jgi:hypothetical protein